MIHYIKTFKFYSANYFTKHFISKTATEKIQSYSLIKSCKDECRVEMWLREEKRINITNEGVSKNASFCIHWNNNSATNFPSKFGFRASKAKPTSQVINTHFRMSSQRNHPLLWVKNWYTISSGKKYEQESKLYYYFLLSSDSLSFSLNIC